MTTSAVGEMVGDGAGENKAIQSISIEALTILKMLTAVDVGDTLTYQEMSEAIGRNVQKEARGMMQTAVNRALVDNTMRFGAIRGVGLKQLSSDEVVEAGQSDIMRIRRASIRGLKKITAIGDFSCLSPDNKINHNLCTTLLSFMKSATTKKNTDKLRIAVTEASAALPLQKALDAFKNSI